MPLTYDQIKRMKEKADLSDLWDEINTLPDDSIRRSVRKMMERVQEVLNEILDVLVETVDSESIAESFVGKEFIIKFLDEHTPK